MAAEAHRKTSTSMSMTSSGAATASPARRERDDGLVSDHGVVSFGLRRRPDDWGKKLYRPARSKMQAVSLAAIPYFLWANRKPGEMLVWIRQ